MIHSYRGILLINKKEQITSHIMNLKSIMLKEEAEYILASPFILSSRTGKTYGGKKIS